MATVVMEQALQRVWRTHRLVRLFCGNVRYRAESFLAAPSAIHGGDLVFFQGHVIPGIYARSFMEGSISVSMKISALKWMAVAFPPSHPWLMPEYWQFPTVSMGLAR